MKREDDHDRRDLIRQNRQRLRAAHQRRKLARIEDVESRRRNYEQQLKGEIPKNAFAQLKNATKNKKFRLMML